LTGANEWIGGVERARPRCMLGGQNRLLRPRLHEVTCTGPQLWTDGLGCHSRGNLQGAAPPPSALVARSACPPSRWERKLRACAPISHCAGPLQRLWPLITADSDDFAVIVILRRRGWPAASWRLLHRLRACGRKSARRLPAGCFAAFHRGSTLRATFLAAARSDAASGWVVLVRTGLAPGRAARAQLTNS